jgi:hypothetical protein
MSATQVAPPLPIRALPLTYNPEGEAQAMPAEGANAREDDALLWQLDEEGWD